MLGHAEFKIFSGDPRYEVWGTLRGEEGRRFFAEADQSRLVSGVDVLNQDSLVRVVNSIRPGAIINCVGLIKQLATAKDPLIVLPVNSLLPHRLAQLAALIDARLIHMSTDCVFSGRSGGYRESDVSDAEDLYGKSKYIGELPDDPYAITLRTSIIGHELQSKNALLEWFLSQHDQVEGYAKSVFSGVPAVELARIMRDFVLPKPNLRGLYHVAAKPISKLNLLELVAKVYGKDIKIAPNESVIVDRSLNSERFTRATGYVAPDWPELVAFMHTNR